MNTEITIQKIHEAIYTLEKTKPGYTYSDIANLCGITKQRVHFIMQKNGLNTGRVQESSTYYTEKLKAIDTASMTIKELAKVVDYKKAPSSLRRILKLNNMKCKYERSNPMILANRLKALDTASMTELEIAQAVNYEHAISSLRFILRYHKLPFKAERQSSSTLYILRKVDTKSKTLDELMKLTDYQHGINSFKAKLAWHDIQYKE